MERSKVDLCIKKIKDKANKVRFETLNQKSNICPNGNCFIFRATIILICEAHARSRLASINIPHAGKKRGQKNQSHSRPCLRFRRHINSGNHDPSGIWLSDAEAIVLRSTIAQPIPQVASREERSELFLHLNSVQRIEVLHATAPRR